MLTKPKIKFIKSLQVKKYRKQEQSFVVEGAKSVQELLNSSFETLWVAGTESFLRDNLKILLEKKIEMATATANELEQLGSFQSNDSAVAIAKMKPNVLPKLRDEVALGLDDIRDPGNLGTIIRTADWYGIRNIIASEETADFYNSKTISATMGSFTRVNIYYCNLVEFISGSNVPIWGAFMDGQDVHQLHFGKTGMLVVGNESNGISFEVGNQIQNRITIPRLGGAESLNAAMATGIILDNIFRSKK